MIQRHATYRRTAGIGQLNDRHLIDPAFSAWSESERVIHVDHPTGINAKAKPQIIATADATT